MNLEQKYQISNKNKSTSVALKDLPLWILLYDEKINGVNIADCDLWSNLIFCKYAVTKNGLCLQYIKKQTLELCMSAVNQNGTSLEFVSKPLINYDLCLAAIKECRFAIKYVPEMFQTEELCMRAIKGKSRRGLLGFNVKDMLTNTNPEFIENGYVIQHIINQTTKVCKYALESTPSSYIYIKHKTPELETHLQEAIQKIEKDSAYYEKILKMLNLF